ncbi:platelet-activating factor acetylhydrolase 2, cytoplasmic-like isoform X1 [Scyliorhinus canicula]|uniref:platelet-activating factor acetylhydrolase 2, cytoplasmic-like isoform X1 n=1 Tax=Scyliorhinus canicula TaxID=7830 RepID=UPI0018F3DB69|nr:platelet-activating factor acetylhydrolase 2, cytoplasmic-like isoform X1 [Scyliorhinus canicula]XP_038654515.1 platelet-activating factor acetylhydrolase 2, cytoplasmic-like isoform X1 [Scyliorhinus canicula]XP_038654524.1 platelet-activating factor acetylhydrolase 2, cytoplasmic-like isoform X1 [Scyliorhinus canicula]XP_038654533.1 platelet-activating factor acetylhydrolase 2, cytoplasmic-like isoform X1 [Scyliorhinus canicula]
MGGVQSLELPPAKGPHKVGCTDIMADHTKQGSFFRLYYPCEASGQVKHPLWIPRYEYCGGLADYLERSKRWCAPVLHLAFGYHEIPVGWDAPFRAAEKYPLIIFSHGLGAFRTVYSAVCIEMASQGFVVAAVEHRDESACATFFFKSPAEDLRQPIGTTTSIEHPPEGPGSPQASPPILEEEWLPYRKIDVAEDDFPLRNQQLHLRVEECSRALDLLAEINNGMLIKNVLPGDFHLSVMKGCFDLQKVAVMGHSFGGSTAILAVAKDQRFRCAVALDSWMFPLTDDIYSSVLRPVFFVNSQKFQTDDSINKMKRLYSTDNEIKIITIVGSVHQSQTDFTLLTGQLLGMAFETKGSIDPVEGLDITNKASLAFLQRHLGLQKDFDQWDALLEGDGHHVILVK